jgi:hypothetical protein
MVTSLFFLTGLTVAAIVIAMVATSDKRVAQNDYTHTRAFYSSDAGSESAINWLRVRNTWPTPLNEQGAVVRMDDFTDLNVSGHYEKNEFKYDMDFDRARFRPGWSKEYRDFDYTILSEGASAKESSAMVEVQASRLFKVVY